MDIGRGIGLESKQRIGWVDSAKAMGIIAIVLGHALSDCGLKTYLFSFHVAFFFFLAGVTFSGGKKRFTEFIFSSVKRILVPYLIFAFISVLIYVLLGRASSELIGVAVDGDFSFKTNMLGFLWGSGKTEHMKANLPLWFLPCLFAVELMCFGIQKLANRFSRLGSSKFILACALIIGSAGYLNMRFLHVEKLPFGFETALNLLPFFALGMALRPFEGSLRAAVERRRAVLVVSAAVLAVLGIYISSLNGFVNYFRDSYGRSFLLFWVGVLCSGAAWSAVAVLFEKCRLLNYIGRRTMPILLMHKMFIVFFQILVSLLPIDGLILLLVQAAYAILSVCLCIIAARIIERFVPFKVF